MDNAVEIEHRLTEVENKTSRNEGRIKKLEAEHETMHNLVTSVSVMADKQVRIESDVKEIKTDLHAIAEKPAKRWDGLIDKVIYGIIGAVITYLLTGGTL